MPWIKLDTSFSRNPKVVTVGSLAAYLYICCLLYCQEHLTNGYLTRSQLRAISDLSRPYVQIKKLLSVGLLEEWEVGDGWKIHDYEVHQRTKEEVQKIKEGNRKRVAKHRSNGVTNALVTRPDTDTDTDTERTSATAVKSNAVTKAKKELKSKRPRPSDLIFEALAECSNLDWHKLTTQERAKLNTAAKELKAIEATPDEIKERAECYRKIYPNIKFTAMGLCSNWSLCAPQEEIQEIIPKGARPLFVNEEERKAFYTGEIIVLPGE